MISISVHFVAGRYHATPWGRHVNEGVPEWPPSPWRLLRAMVATWKRTLPEVPNDTMAPVLAALSGAPEFTLPTAVPAHTRHYMPWFKKGPNDRTLIFDTFAAVARTEPVIISWPDAELDSDQQKLLQQVLTNMNYLGRAESWCEAELISEAGEPNCKPLPDGEAIPVGSTPVPVLTPEPAEPDQLLQALLVETGQLRSKDRRLDPPGSRWVRYGLPTDRLVSHPRRQAAVLQAPIVHAARYALDGKPLPSLTRAVEIGELARRAVLSQFGGKEQRPAPAVLSGHHGPEPTQSQHQHAFYLPTDEDGDGRIDHITIVAPAGFGSEEQQALGRINKLWQGGEDVARLILLGMVPLDRLQETCSAFSPSAVWESATPYLQTRHPKRYKDGRPKLNEQGEQIDGPEDQIRREWALRRTVDPTLPELVGIERLERCRVNDSKTLHWLQFRRWRSRGPGPASASGYGFRLKFSAPVGGPVALGYGCHFGLGLFRPIS